MNWFFVFLPSAQAVSAAIEKICVDGHKVFVTWKFPPLKMKTACALNNYH